MRVLDQVWIWYLSTVSVLAAAFAGVARGGHPLAYLAIHVGLLAALLVLRRRLDGVSARRERVWRGLFSLAAVLVVFSSIGLVLPAINPEPHEYRWIELDRLLLGRDPTVALQAMLTPWVTEVLQWAYVTFYLMPVSVVVAAALTDRRAYDVTLVTVTFCFLLSYLGYFLWPTLPPREFLHHPEPLAGVFLTDLLHRTVDSLEFNHWDCFPSGHVMLALVSLVLAWRHVRVVFWPMLPLALLMTLSTVALRYHYVSDVIAGVAFTFVGLWLSSRLTAAIGDQTT